MTSSYPGVVADIARPVPGLRSATPTELATVLQLADEVLAIKTELGINPSAAYTDVVTRLASLVTVIYHDATIAGSNTAIDPLGIDIDAIIGALTADSPPTAGDRELAFNGGLMKLLAARHGVTGSRPNATLVDPGTRFYDTTTAEPLFSTGAAWVALERAGVAAAADKVVIGNRQTGTAYTCVLTDAGKQIETNNASANTVTVPPFSSVAWPTGSVFSVMQYGAGITTIAAGAGVTLRRVSGASLALTGQYAVVLLRNIATDEWLVSGSLT